MQITMDETDFYILLDSYRRTIKKLQTDVNVLNATIDDMNGYDCEVSALKNEIANLKDDYEEEIAELKEVIAKLRKQLHRWSISDHTNSCQDCGTTTTITHHQTCVVNYGKDKTGGI